MFFKNEQLLNSVNYLIILLLKRDIITLMIETQFSIVETIQGNVFFSHSNRLEVVFWGCIGAHQQAYQCLQMWGWNNLWRTGYPCGVYHDVSSSRG